MAERHCALAAARQQVRFLKYPTEHYACPANSTAAVVALTIMLMRSDGPEDTMHDAHHIRKDAGAGTFQLHPGFTVREKLHCQGCV